MRLAAVARPNWTARAPRSAGDARALRVRPLAVSAAVCDALAHGAAIVRAEHRYGASLALPGTDDAVFMSTPGRGLLPAHIVVCARDLDRILEATQSDGAATANPGEELSLHFDIQGVRVFLPRLAPHPAEMRAGRTRANVTAAAHWLRAYPAPLGLGATAAQLLAPSGRWRNYLLAIQHDQRQAESAFRALVGRGAGSTPAGDDFLIGMLAHAWVTQGREAAAVATLRSLAAELPSLTTTVGASYLRAAARGEFGSHLIAWVRGLPRVSPQRGLELARRAAAHGATSGYDTLVGFVAAAEAADANTRLN